MGRLLPIVLGLAKKGGRPGGGGPPSFAGRVSATREKMGERAP